MSSAGFFLLLSRKAELAIRKAFPDSLIDRARKATAVRQGIRSYQEHPGALAFSFLITILVQVAGIISAYLLGIAVGCTTAFLYYIVLLPVVWLISMIPVSLNGLGLREGAFVVLFSAIGMPKEAALAISLLLLAQGVLQGILGALLYVTDHKDISSIRTYVA